MLSFTLLGQTVLSKNGAPLANFRSQKEAALLVYLAQTGQAHPRDFLAELLWESSSTKQSLTNLRTVLTRLRQNVGDVLRVTRTSVALKPENRQQVDSAILLEALAKWGPGDTAVNPATLQNILHTYQGDFLADFNLADAPQFNEWVTVTREHIRRQIIAAYDKLGQHWLAAGEYETGIVTARRWLAVDVLDEAAHTLLIQLLLKVGKVREATAQYEQCVALLHRELRVAPPAELTALIKEIRPQPIANRSVATAVSHHNLPPSYDQFFGRRNAQQEIHTRLDQPWCRLVTITGQGGVGKTRLAATIARSRLNQYRDGAWLVELANLDADDEDLAEAIAVEIATVLDLRLTGSATPVAQLLDHLQHKQMMLVLDNFEHLLTGLQIILDIMERCEQVQLIVTSREALRLRAEWALSLAGLSYPTSDSDEIASDAVELFVARRAQQQRGAVAEDDLAAIRQICRLVAGLPLAIELAAALTRRTTVRAVADGLHNSFDLLTTAMRDVPERHRGLQTVFEMSWRTLAPELQQQLARLSVFRGGFTATAVAQITHATPHHLAALIDKSLLTTSQAEPDRYTLHPVIRAYAAGKREVTDPTPHKHAHYYLTLLAQHTDPLQKERPQESMRLLEPDIDNIRRAWQTALAEQNADLLTNALTSLSIYYQLRGLAHEGNHLMHSTMSAAAEWDSNGVLLVTRAGLERARFQNRLGQYRPAIQTIQTTLKLADQCADRWAEGMAHVWWGEALWRLGQYDAAKEKLTLALNIGHDLNAILIIGWCHHQLGIIHDIQSRYAAAHDHLEKACAAWRELSHARNLSVSLNSIGLVYRNQGNLTVAKQAMEQALNICIEQDNRYLQAMLFSNLSTIYLTQGDHFGAHYYLQLGLDLATATGSLHSQSELFANIGKNYRLQGENDLARQNLERGLAIAEKIGNHPSMAVGLHNLADVLCSQGDVQRAELVYKRALEITQQNGLKSIECDVLISLAMLLSKHNAVKARLYSQKLAALAKDIDDPNWIERAEAVSQMLK